MKFFQKNKFTSVLYNTTQLQDFVSTVCGQYCCVYLLSRVKNITLQKFIEKNFKSDHLKQKETKELSHYLDETSSSIKE